MSEEVRREILSIAREIEMNELVGFRSTRNHSLERFSSDRSECAFYMNGPRPAVNLHQTRNPYQQQAYSDKEEQDLLILVRELRNELVGG